ncbi:MAG: hypothetical protein Kow00128_09140 [Deltaproteobacteria bacterium]
MYGIRQALSRFLTGISPAFLAVSLFLLLPSSSRAESFAYQDLHPAGWISSVARCVNDAGEVVGYGLTPQGERGFAWSGGIFLEILPPGADSARAAWVNGMGEIAGTGTTDGVPHAFLLKDGTYRDPTPGWGWSEATYVGEDGSVAGRGWYGGDTVVFVSRDSVVEIFPGFTSVAGGNRSGQWVGSSGSSSRLYIPGQGYLDVTPPGAATSTPHGINDSGLIAGAALRSGAMKGYVKSGEFYIDMNPPGWTSSQATGINDYNEVVGYGESGSGTRSFLRVGGSIEEIVFPGWTSTEAASLNNAGQVAGSGTTAEGRTHAFLASPPVPASPGNPSLPQGPGAAGGCSVAGTSQPADPYAASAAAGLWILSLFLIRRAGRIRR